MQCQQISVGHGQEEVIDVALATAVRTDTWLVIENLQLASRLWLEQLYNRLSRLQLQAGTCCVSVTKGWWAVVTGGWLGVGEGGGFMTYTEKDLNLKDQIGNRKTN